MADEGAVLAAREQEVNALLQNRKGADALKKSLAAPPFESKEAEIKSASYAVVAKVIFSFTNDTERQAAVDGLDSAERDTLMKYLYRGLGTFTRGEEQGQLLKLHGYLVDKAGLGCVVRTLADIKSKA